MFGQDRASLRAVFFGAWQKHQARQPLEPLEKQIVAILLEHPEYHSAVADPDLHGDRDYQAEAGESNPFLHLSLHLAIRDQIAMDRPVGVRRLVAALTESTGQPHDAEHRAMEQLGQVLWEAQRSGGQPDEHVYLANLQQLLRQLDHSL